jgi:hypothetical protein
MSNEKPRRLWAIIRNAVTWGITWGALGTAVATVFRLNDKIPFVNALLDGIGMGVRIGVAGAFTGAAFAAFISLAYRGKNLREISPLRWMETMSLLTGGGLVPFHLINGDIVYSALFGGITAAGTMIMAQRDEVKNPDTVQDLLERMDTQSLGAGTAGYHDTRATSRETRDRI